MRKEIHLLVLLMLLFVYQMIANFFISNDSCVAYGNPVAIPYLWIIPTTYVATELGETFTIDINISGISGLHAFEFKLGYNTSLLDAVQVTQGPFFPTPPNTIITKLETNETTGQVWLGMSLSDPEASESGSGTLATVTFEVTFAPSSPSRTWCALDLYESALYDSAMAQIPHDSVNGLYFWQTVLEDPPETGLAFDLTTQRGGIGPNVTDGIFILGEVVELIGNLTYAGEPVQQKFVSFEVRNPLNEVVVPRTAITNENGYANISFRIPSISTSIGTWTAFAISSVDCQNVWDWISFIVISPPVGGYTTFIERESASTLRMDVCSYLDILAMLAIAVFLAVTIAKNTQNRKKA